MSETIIGVKREGDYEAGIDESSPKPEQKDGQEEHQEQKDGGQQEQGRS